ncbi:hypothetical protein RHMOL_Rhmol03G0161500 [Rhododendron molle]|uniref:Uncharacterized protein n=2 Tax=Rhododendron molle TaxID=49168 RepID=A0ACC0PHV8_RHOML|nr:hypothetical protein RHMOL_Rhmol03G0161500 [Rhododendron molle]KAI8564173.1 hypothetical protein RHMOL_Rhmol03G0161500 [Rhododendron molle]
MSQPWTCSELQTRRPNLLEAWPKCSLKNNQSGGESARGRTQRLDQLTSAIPNGGWDSDLAWQIAEEKAFQVVSKSEERCWAGVVGRSDWFLCCGSEEERGCLSCYSLIMIKTHRDCFWSLPSYCGSLEERTIKFLLPLLLWTFDNTDPLLLARVLVWWCLRRKCDVSCCRPSVVLLMTNG